MEFQSKADYDQAASQLAAAYSVYDWLDDRVLQSRHAFTYPAFCAACGHVTAMRIDWTYSGAGTSTSVNPAWTETARCETCGLNSRMRAVIDFLKTHCELDTIREVYVAEQITNQSGKARRVRHEDLTALSFDSGQFDLAITQDVFEHIPNYQKAFSELQRVLKPGGLLVFTIPFFYELENTRIRASVGSEGIIHHLPAEMHGNPVSTEGSLCYQNFGWDILLDLKKCGFKQARANMYWGPWQGHLGYPFFVFSASKR
jgi:SAM-dependent methyltransferase